MIQKQPFKWRHYENNIILLCVRWYFRIRLSYRYLAEMMRERGLSVHHSTIYRWIQAYSAERGKRSRSHFRKSNDSYRVDDTYIKAAKRFFRKILNAPHTVRSRVVNVDKNPAYLPVFSALQKEGVISKRTKLLACKDLNKVVKQSHRPIKKKVLFF